MHLGSYSSSTRLIPRAAAVVNEFRAASWLTARCAFAGAERCCKMLRKEILFELKRKRQAERHVAAEASRACTPNLKLNKEKNYDRFRFDRRPHINSQHGARVCAERGCAAHQGVGRAAAF